MQLMFFRNSLSKSRQPSEQNKNYSKDFERALELFHELWDVGDSQNDNSKMRAFLELLEIYDRLYRRLYSIGQALDLAEKPAAHLRLNPAPGNPVRLDLPAFFGILYETIDRFSASVASVTNYTDKEKSQLAEQRKKKWDFIRQVLARYPIDSV